MTEHPLLKPIEILLVEDNPGDADLTQEAMENSKIRNNIHVVGDGETALAYLKKEGHYREALRPDLILLDLNLPRKDGWEVLAELKEDENLRRIPVVILTTSRNEEDVIRTYNLHANCFISKPIDLMQFIKVVKSIENFWMTIVTLPPNGIKK